MAFTEPFETESGYTILDKNDVVAVTKTEEGYEIHLTSGTIFTTGPDWIPFFDIFTR